ncbi:MAG: subclass B3 metallo-beta-lactamase [Candidatus Solibacter usitatus]|nr:subclass B3 metallo-beta-lactamase [Candidatus Solibacter usitatus]
MLLKLLLILAAAPILFAQNDWDDPYPPHRIAGNLYYVGSKGLSTYLITSSKGHILINSSFDRTLPIIRNGVEKLGFKFNDVKILLTSHAHSDHVAGNAQIKELTGAAVYVMQGDEKVVASGGQGQYRYPASWKPCKVDKVLKDGEKVTLGEAELTAVLTPGHTRGCTTWTMKVKEGAKTYDVVIIGSPNVNPGYQLVGNTAYPEIADDFAKTFRILKGLPCDIFLGAHGSYYGMEGKFALTVVGTPKTNPFVDPAGYHRYIDDRERAYKKVLAEQKKQ